MPALETDSFQTEMTGALPLPPVVDLIPSPTLTPKPATARPYTPERKPVEYLSDVISKEQMRIALLYASPTQDGTRARFEHIDYDLVEAAFPGLVERASPESIGPLLDRLLIRTRGAIETTVFQLRHEAKKRKIDNPSVLALIAGVRDLHPTHADIKLNRDGINEVIRILTREMPWLREADLPPMKRTKHFVPKPKPSAPPKVASEKVVEPRQAAIPVPKPLPAADIPLLPGRYGRDNYQRQQGNRQEGILDRLIRAREERARETARLLVAQGATGTTTKDAVAIITFPAGDMDSTGLAREDIIVNNGATKEIEVFDPIEVVAAEPKAVGAEKEIDVYVAPIIDSAQTTQDTMKPEVDPIVDPERDTTELETKPAARVETPVIPKSKKAAAAKKSTRNPIIKAGRRDEVKTDAPTTEKKTAQIPAATPRLIPRDPKAGYSELFRNILEANDEHDERIIDERRARESGSSSGEPLFLKRLIRD